MNAGYSKISFKHEWQSDAVLVPKGWRKKNEALLLRTEPIESELEPLVADFPEIRRLEFDYLSSGSLEIVSSRFADYLRPRIHAEFIPVGGQHAGKPYTAKRFYLVHFLDQFSAVDLKRSIYTLWPAEAGGGIQAVSKLVLDDSKIDGSAAFILDELALVCFRDDLCQEICEAGFEGFNFTPLSEYRNVWSQE